MRIRQIVATTLIAIGVLATPAAAQAATLTAAATKPCYGTNDRVPVTGTGFTPNGPVTLMQGERALRPSPVADANGAFGGTASVQPISASEEVAPYTATDEANPAIVATSQPIRFSRVRVTGRKAGANGLIQRVRARGFTTGGRRLYAHIRRGGRKVKDLRIGRLRRACRTLNVRKRFFKRGAKPATYTIYFDTYRRYRKGRRQQTRGKITVFRISRPSAAGASASTARLWPLAWSGSARASR